MRSRRFITTDALETYLILCIRYREIPRYRFIGPYACVDPHCVHARTLAIVHTLQQHELDNRVTVEL